MRDIYRKATVSQVEVEELYGRKLTADIDGANGLIELTRTTAKYTDGIIGDTKTTSISISFEELRRLNMIMSELEEV